MSSALKHLTKIESIDLWAEYFADPKVFILPQLKAFPNCQYLKMPFDLFENMLEYLNEESDGAAKDVDLSKRKIQKLSPKIGFRNLKRLKIISLKKNYIEGDKLIELKLIPSLEVMMFSGWIGLNDAEELEKFIDNTSLKKIIFENTCLSTTACIEIIRNSVTEKFDKDKFYELFC